MNLVYLIFFLIAQSGELQESPPPPGSPAAPPIESMNFDAGAGEVIAIPSTEPTTVSSTDSMSIPAATQSTTRPTTQSTTAVERSSSRSDGSRWHRRGDSERNRTQPAIAATGPANPLVPRIMSPEFSILLSRSMFVKGHVSVDAHRFGGTPPPAAAPPTTEPSLVSRPETSLVFNGVTVANGSPMAFIEDTANGHVLTVQVGQDIAQGKITDITLDTLAYRNSMRTVVLHMGQDFSGKDAVAIDASTTAPSANGELPSTGNSVLDAMRKKRQQELLGK